MKIGNFFICEGEGFFIVKVERFCVLKAVRILFCKGQEASQL